MSQSQSSKSLRQVSAVRFLTQTRPQYQKLELIHYFRKIRIIKLSLKPSPLIPRFALDRRDSLFISMCVLE